MPFSQGHPEHPMRARHGPVCIVTNAQCVLAQCKFPVSWDSYPRKPWAGGGLNLVPTAGTGDAGQSRGTGWEPVGRMKNDTFPGACTRPPAETRQDS